MTEEIKEEMTRKKAPELSIPDVAFSDRRELRVNMVRKALGSKANGKTFVYKGKDEDRDMLREMGYEVALTENGNPKGDKGDVLYMIDEKLYNERLSRSARRSATALTDVMSGNIAESEHLHRM